MVDHRSGTRRVVGKTYEGANRTTLGEREGTIVKLSVGMKIAGGFFLLLILLGVIAGSSIYIAGKTISELEDVDVRAQRLALDNAINSAFAHAVLGYRGYMGYQDEQYVDQYQREMAKTKQLMAERLKNCSEEARPKFEHALQRIEHYDRTVSGTVIPLIRQGDLEGAQAAGAVVAPIIIEIDEFITGYVDLNNERNKAIIAEVKSHTNQGRLLVMIVGVVALLVGVVLAFLVTRSITGPVRVVMDGVRRLADGDFTQRIEVKSKDEMGQLARATNQMREQLRELVGNITGISHALAAHSQEMAASTEEVSATIEEVAGTTSEVSSVSQQGSENALAAAADAERVQHVAERGDEAVGDTVAKINSIAAVTQQVNTAVQELGSTSKQIGDITNVITNIADQTNLLALNAAIEAARAGEQGRGFAVVAEEVRKLAEQSANAAKEISGLISSVQREVDQAVVAMGRGINEVQSGVEVANNAGDSLKEIISAVRNTTGLIRDVAQGANQTNEGTLQLSAATQQISSSIQEVAAAAGELARMGERLSGAVARFKV